MCNLEREIRVVADVVELYLRDNVWLNVNIDVDVNVNVNGIEECIGVSDMEIVCIERYRKRCKERLEKN